jgi:xanthine dehydrogenase small subunit
MADASLIRFVFRGDTVSVPNLDPTRSVLQWLREDARACGTKEGCAEGDCGACTVIVAELAESVDPDNRAVIRDGLALRPVNSCIRFLPTLHGKALLSVEDLGGHHPAQQAMVSCHGSQCGFCTPGFVMSMALSHERRLASGVVPARSELADDLAGNLCRCTGYRPILDAAQQMVSQGNAGLSLQGLREQLQALAATPLVGPGFAAPQSLAELARLRLERPEARLLAGGTDIGLWVTKQFRDLGEVLWLGDVAELRRLHVDGDMLHIGAAVTLEDAWAALARHWPHLREMGLRFAGPPVRHAGTLVGNLANGSPIGDSAPALMPLGAVLRLRRGDVLRELPLDAFYLDYMKNALQPGELVEALRVPLASAQPDSGWVHRAWKISKRVDCDISALSAGLSLQLQGDLITDARLVWGGMAATVRPATGAQSALMGQCWDEASLRAAQNALAADFTPLTDLRASADYRRAAARGLLRRLWLETRRQDPLGAGATRASPLMEHRP